MAYRHFLTLKNLFLVDSLGALCTALLLSLLLAQMHSTFGMPPNVLYVLSFLAGIFALYSFICYRTTPGNWKFYLKIIAIANLLYCCLTIGLMYYFYEQLTAFGLGYFILEIGIVVILAGIELKTALRS